MEVNYTESLLGKIVAVKHKLKTEVAVCTHSSLHLIQIYHTKPQD